MLCRWHRDSEWATCRWQREDTDAAVVNFEWKEVAEPVMQQYTESTDGSYIEWKESAMVWHHRDADPDFGSWQAKELLDHLGGVLANQPVTVKSGAHIVEVKPQVTLHMSMCRLLYHYRLTNVKSLNLIISVCRV